MRVVVAAAIFRLALPLLRIMLPADVVHFVGREGVRNAKAIHELLAAADGNLQDFKKDRPSNLAHRGEKSNQPVEVSPLIDACVSLSSTASTFIEHYFYYCH
jgi:hypothetical protein